MSETRSPSPSSVSRKTSRFPRWARHIASGALLIAASSAFVFCFKDAAPGRLGTLVGAVLTITCCVSTVTDLLWRKIFNLLVGPAFATLVAVNVAATFWSDELARLGIFDALGAIGAGPSLCGAAVCFLFTGIPFALGQGGAGDVKLAAAVGAGFGVVDGIVAIGLAYLFAFFFAIVVLIKRYGPRYVARLLFKRDRGSSDESDDVPSMKKTAIPLAPGFCVAVVGLLVDCGTILAQLVLTEN